MASSTQPGQVDRCDPPCGEQAATYFDIPDPLDKDEIFVDIVDHPSYFGCLSAFTGAQPILLAEQVRTVPPWPFSYTCGATIRMRMVDIFLCEAVVTRAAQRATNRIVVVPTLRYGDSAHHLPFPDVLTLSSGGYMAAVGELCDSLYRSGFRRWRWSTATAATTPATRSPPAT